MGPKWGQTVSAASCARGVVERVERGGDVVKLIVKQVRVGVRCDGDRCVAHRLLEESEVSAGPSGQ